MSHMRDERKLMGKVTKKATHNHTRIIRVEKRTIQVRKASNFEIMRDAFDKHGYVKFNVSLRVMQPNGVYAGWHGAGITLVASSIEAAEALPKQLRDAVAKIASELGMTATRRDAPI